MSTALPEERATQPPYLSGNVAKWLLAILPGIALTSAVAAASYELRSIPGLTILSPMILSIFLGIFIRNTVGTPVIAKAGIAFSLRRVLRFAIILLGLQLTAAQAAEVGATGLAVIVTGLIATFLFTKWLAHMIGVERKLAELIAAGTSICGASAVVATNTVTDAPDEDVAYAVACVTVFGSIAMFVYPLLPGVLHLSEHAFGLWAGASIHEIAQVVAAAYQDGSRAGDFATIAKLSRVMMLAPVVIALGLVARRKNGTGVGGAARVPLPLFVLGFIALAGINSIIPIPAAVKLPTAAVTTFLLSVALAAMGLETDIAKLRMKGLRPFFLGLAAFLFISAFSLMLVSLTT